MGVWVTLQIGWLPISAYYDKKQTLHLYSSCMPSDPRSLKSIYLENVLTIICRSIYSSSNACCIFLVTTPSFCPSLPHATSLRPSPTSLFYTLAISAPSLPSSLAEYYCKPVNVVLLSMVAGIGRSYCTS